MFGNSEQIELNLAKRRNEIEQRLEALPQGFLGISKIGNTVSFYHKIKADTQGNYLSKSKKEDTKLIGLLAEKRYLRKALAVVQKDLDAIHSYNLKKSDKTLANIFDELPDCIKEYISPYEISDNEYAKRWISIPYTKSQRPFTNTQFVTNTGEKVRSKSELVIADKLTSAGIPYKYEKRYKINEAIYCPDFTILNKRTRQEYIWEHFGLMDNPEYQMKAMQKIEMYTRYELITGIKFIATFETAVCPLSTVHIDNMISNNLV